MPTVSRRAAGGTGAACCAGRDLDGRHDDAENVHRPPDLLAEIRQPALLQAAQRDGGGRVAGEDHEARARSEQGFAARFGERDDLFARPPAIRGVRLIGQIGEIGVGHALDQRAMHGQAADAGIEHADGHDASARHAEITLQHALVDIGQRGNIGDRHVLVDFVHRLADEAEFRDRAVILDEAGIRGAAAG